jgi:hypothetical protein
MKKLESNRKSIKEFSKDNPGITFAVRCTNYADENTYYLKNGIFCKNTCFNSKYDFNLNKVKLSCLKNDGIYLATELENKKLYNI